MNPNWIVSSPHEWTPEGDDGREVMSFAQESPRTKLGLVPRPVDHNVVAIGYYSAQESVRAPPVTPRTVYRTTPIGAAGGTRHEPPMFLGGGSMQQLVGSGLESPPV